MIDICLEFGQGLSDGRCVGRAEIRGDREHRQVDVAQHAGYGFITWDPEFETGRQNSYGSGYES